MPTAFKVWVYEEPPAPPAQGQIRNEQFQQTFPSVVPVMPAAPVVTVSPSIISNDDERMGLPSTCSNGSGAGAALASLQQQQHHDNVIPKKPQFPQQNAVTARSVSIPYHTHAISCDENDQKKDNFNLVETDAGEQQKPLFKPLDPRHVKGILQLVRDCGIAKGATWRKERYINNCGPCNENNVSSVYPVKNIEVEIPTKLNRRYFNPINGSFRALKRCSCKLQQKKKIKSEMSRKITKVKLQEGSIRSDNKVRDQKIYFKEQRVVPSGSSDSGGNSAELSIDHNHWREMLSTIKEALGFEIVGDLPSSTSLPTKLNKVFSPTEFLLPVCPCKRGTREETSCTESRKAKRRCITSENRKYSDDNNYLKTVAASTNLNPRQSIALSLYDNCLSDLPPKPCYDTKTQPSSLPPKPCHDTETEIQSSSPPSEPLPLMCSFTSTIVREENAPTPPLIQSNSDVSAEVKSQ